MSRSAPWPVRRGVLRRWGGKEVSDLEVPPQLLHVLLLLVILLFSSSTFSSSQTLPETGIILDDVAVVVIHLSYISKFEKGLGSYQVILILLISLSNDEWLG